ncbi:hypothetical protein UW163_22690 (plasmid) [Ralstonia solanacearum]|nr:hypothetical protein UW163_22690 [Ralstonia solanacearum]AMP76824.1 hypothetical protein RALBFv3_22145 [Ralstonia solanacearum]EUJ13152.1 hypothetical protein RSP673_17440 [Ralstonia solanacearum P673]OAI69077.1 hypothetical protein RSP797_17530 [Ralstonia solanacearum]
MLKDWQIQHQCRSRQFVDQDAGSCPDVSGAFMGKASSFAAIVGFVAVEFALRIGQRLLSGWRHGCFSVAPRSKHDARYRLACIERMCIA